MFVAAATAATATAVANMFNTCVANPDADLTDSQLFVSTLETLVEANRTGMPCLTQ